jgi:hypothetical protein
MGIGVSVFLIALGAILAYAVQDAIPGVELNTVGVILMIAGVAGLLISLFYTLLWTRRDPAAGYDRVPPGPVAERERVVERDRI